MQDEKTMQDYTPELPLTILNFRIEGYKKVRNIKIVPAPVGLTKLGGKNKQGKTSLLDGASHGLLGPEMVDRNANPINDDATVIPKTRGARSRLHIEFVDGTIVERRLTDKNSRSGVYEVSLPSGQAGTLDDIKNCISKFALNPPNLEAMSERERLKWFLGGLNIDLTDLEEKLDTVTTERKSLYIEKEKAQKHANDLPQYDGLPPEEVKASTVMEQLQKAMDANAANRSERQEVERLETREATLTETAKDRADKVVELKSRLEQAEKEQVESEQQLLQAKSDLATAKESIGELKDIPTDELRSKLEQIEELNKKIRENKTKEQRNSDAQEIREQWTAKEKEQIDVLREMKQRVKEADCPLPDIAVNQELCITFDNRVWANMSGMQKVVFRTAVASLYNKNASMVFCDGLEQLDEDTQIQFHKWAVSRGLQVIATEVAGDYKDSDDGITKLIIEDGSLKGGAE